MYHSGCSSNYNKSRIREYSLLYNKNVSKILNNSVSEQNTVSDFIPVSQNDIIYYTSPDPRLVKVASNTHMVLDKPPYQTDIKLSNIYEENLRNYGKNYTSYNDINGGQITYYINNKNDPNFNDQDVRTIYVDPMGSGYNEFCNIPKIEKNPLTDSVNLDGGFCLTWMKDTMSNREDSMYYAQSNINRITINR